MHTQQRFRHRHAWVSDQPEQGTLNVGQSLRRLREERGLSIRVLADASNLAANTLSLIENNKTSPSVSTLQQIATALGVNITAFFEPQDSGTNVAYVRSNERLRMAFAHGILEYLGTGLCGQPVQPCLVTLEPGSDSSNTPIVHTGYEFVYGLSGRITYSVEDRIFMLEPGDSLLFESHLPHQWRNVSTELSQMLLVLIPTDEHDKPTEHHFALTALNDKSG